MVATVNETPLLAMPSTLTTIGPLVAEAGTGAVMLAALQLLGVATVPLKEMELEPWLAPNPEPAIVIEVPAGADVGETEPITGLTVKLTLLLATPLTVTTTGPVVAFTGTATVILPVFQLAAVAVTPLNVSVLEPWLEPKFEPVMITDVPTAPDFGEMLLMVGVFPQNAGPATIKTKTERREEKNPDESFLARAPSVQLELAGTIRVRIGYVKCILCEMHKR